MNQSAQLIIVAITSAIGIAIGGCGTTPTAGDAMAPTQQQLPSIGGSCNTRYHDPVEGVGLDSPLGWTVDACISVSCNAAWSNGAGSAITLYVVPLDPAGLRAHVDKWVAAYGAANPGRQFGGSVTVSFFNGESG